MVDGRLARGNYIDASRVERMLRGEIRSWDLLLTALRGLELVSSEASYSAEHAIQQEVTSEHDET